MAVKAFLNHKKANPSKVGKGFILIHSIGVTGKKQYLLLHMMIHATDILEFCSVLKYDILIIDRGNSNQTLMWEPFVID